MSSSDERSPKRQRRSYSPASPPLDTKRPAGGTPQTPPPSVRMSPSMQSQTLPGLGMQGNSTTFPTPPSTAGFQSQMMARGVSSEGGGMESAQNTPAEEGETTQRTNNDRDAEMKDQTQEVGDVAMAEADPEHRRTDHERQELPPPTASNVLYKLSTQPIPPSQPHPSENLLHLYSLQRIQSAVARRDPLTGDKINKLRRSYEGKVRDLGLEGKNKVELKKKEEKPPGPPIPGPLEGLVDPGWDIDVNGDGRTHYQNDKAEFLLGEHSVGDLMQKLDKAFDLRPGRLPGKEHGEWRSMLGLDETVPSNAKTAGTNGPVLSVTTQLPSGPNKSLATNLLAKTAPATAIRNSAPASPSRGLGARPERAGKKRRYDESSYTGYHEGYEDDGYSTGGIDEAGRRGSASKRRKRKVSGRAEGFYARIAGE